MNVLVIKVDDEEEVESMLLIRPMVVVLDGNQIKQRQIIDHPLLLEGGGLPMVNPLMATQVNKRPKIDKRLLNRPFGVPVPVEHPTSPIFRMDLLVEDIEKVWPKTWVLIHLRM
jgi:hypothetical protein